MPLSTEPSAGGLGGGEYFFWKKFFNHILYGALLCSDQKSAIPHANKKDEITHIMPGGGTSGK